ncbi:TetR/AcrR family transcriptional regulator [Nonomuraea africana]|uniref:AcrR family transcriptional regulator n=1 Tax=Nonomuraea africana TaxID=46171 RepID=A0ABR9KB41_9ACTN|nr:TetR/AcrR family transcriptional regulator [Nonomuraea africana]MBE1559231.1 AcrR family transcriptional regulator [Nonomuraea africana]
MAAVRQLLAETGYERLTVDAVAARAGVGKAAIYRRYASKVEMVFAATLHDDDLPPPADTGSLHGDLLAIAHRVHARMNTPAARQIGPAVIAELSRSSELTEKFQQGPLAAERQLYATVLDRATARGELARPADPAVVHLLVSGPIFFAVSGYRISVDDAVLEAIATTVTAGLRS